MDILVKSSFAQNTTSSLSTKLLQLSLIMEDVQVIVVLEVAMVMIDDALVYM